MLKPPLPLGLLQEPFPIRHHTLFPLSPTRQNHPHHARDRFRREDGGVADGVQHRHGAGVLHHIQPILLTQLLLARREPFGQTATGRGLLRLAAERSAPRCGSALVASPADGLGSALTEGLWEATVPKATARSPPGLFICFLSPGGFPCVRSAAKPLDKFYLAMIDS
jgi:hypothetical protein